MTMINTQSSVYSENPLDIVEQVVMDHDWPCDRRGEGEMVAQVAGQWCDYSLYFSWNDEIKAVHFSCGFDMLVPDSKRRQVNDLLAEINAKMWMGHFGLWTEEGLPMYQHSLPMRGALGPSTEQMEDLLETAIAECDRFYPAFQYVVWSGKSAREAMLMAMVDPVGEA